MKNAPRLAINTGVSHIFRVKPMATFTNIAQSGHFDKKYFGDPESPNFLPDSPLINRPVLSRQEENELKFICGLVLANVKSSDDSGTDPLSEIIQSLQAQEALPVQAVPRHKAQVSARTAPKPAANSRHHVARPENRPNHERDNAGTFNRPSKPNFTDSPTAQPLTAHSNAEALWAIRSRLSSRPKTSAAACIDYAGENTDPSSRPSNRTTYTTYSTPATSIGNTTGGGKKSYTQDEPAMPTLDLYGLLSQSDSPSRDDAQVRAWMDEQFDHRPLGGSNDFDYPTNSLRDFYPTHRQEETEQVQPQIKRKNSIRNNIQEYFRPGSSLSNAPHRTSLASNIKEYIRPGSSAGSIRSIATNTSSRSRTQEHWSSIKRKFSSASRVSQRSNRKGAEDAGTDGNVQGEKEIDLNRPLPPLPGLDSYKEKKTHIASLMKKVQAPKKGPKIAVDSRSTNYPKPLDGPTQRYSNYSVPTSFNNMSAASLGSISTSLNAPNSAHQSSTSLERLQSRPHAQKPAVSVGVSPLSQSAVPKAESKKEGFAKRWGGKFSRGKKAKTVVPA